MNTKKVHIREQIAQSQRYIEEHLNTTVPLESLAEQCGYSPLYFHSIFTGIVGEGVKEYQRRLRLQRAATQLLFSETSLIEIALDAGYESQEGFSRAFKKRFAYSPLKFRRLQSDYSFLSGGKLMDTPTQHTDLEVTIKKCAPITVAAARHIGPYSECKTAFSTLCNWAREQGLYGSFRQVFGISHDDPRTTPAEKLRYDACMEIPEDFVVAGEAQKYTIHGGRYACCIHKGSYAKIPETFVAMLGSWFPDSGEELTNHPPLEVYLNCPSSTPEDELLTELRIPLK
ncbi:AraC family transcriptional regulator [Halodesulfovibrio marinisediminis]|uniref:AraC family transcriptional regulator n=1 Tax=Halodesulfovibrio marinisediminis DSM 17456 TaxID=1121457 RepID=A0A1N6H9V1_9BACT|nr:GyrI-like domain-containing protein [Halodesulfovibrio marinisediminis]SIO16520.1 AraC family transcriptional regulator [Halodesulfovibrio marinisediminis DSM 17456]